MCGAGKNDVPGAVARIAVSPQHKQPQKEMDFLGKRINQRFLRLKQYHEQARDMHG